MEAMQLVDRLERLITEGLHVPMTTNVIVNEPECLDIIDHLRTLLQEERRISASATVQRPAIEEEPVVGPVQSYIPPEVAETDVAKAAQTHANQLIAAAQKEAGDLKSEADQYVLDELQQLQSQLELIQRRVRNGIRTLRKEGS
jgi:cell division septum initiation protein DivIVA